MHGLPRTQGQRREIRRAHAAAGYQGETGVQLGYPKLSVTRSNRGVVTLNSMSNDAAGRTITHDTYLAEGQSSAVGSIGRPSALKASQEDALQAQKQRIHRLHLEVY